MKSLMELELLSWDVQIPAKFGVSSFTKKNTTTYYADASQKSIATLMKNMKPIRLI
jgi:hypothetical protein